MHRGEGAAPLARTARDCPPSRQTLSVLSAIVEADIDAVGDHLAELLPSTSPSSSNLESQIMAACTGAGVGVTPGFKDKTECIAIYMPGSSFHTNRDIISE